MIMRITDKALYICRVRPLCVLCPALITLICLISAIIPDADKCRSSIKDKEYITLFGHKMALLEQNDPALDIEDTEEDEVDLYDEYIDYADEMWDL